MTIMPKPFYSTKEVATILKIHEGHVRRLATQLSVGQLVGKQHVFTSDDIRVLETRNRQPGRKSPPQEVPTDT